MSSSTTLRRAARIVAPIAIGVLCLPLAAQAEKKPRPPRPAIVTTGAALHVLNTSALLTGTVNPLGPETTYYFQYGPTIAYGSQTAAAALPAGAPREKVGQPVVGLVSGTTYHYRLVASNVNSPTPVLGHDRTFMAKGAKLSFVIPKPASDTYGTPFVISGTLAGVGGANHRVVLQASPFPYLEAFTNIGAPGVTDSRGRFSFRVTNLVTSTQFRVVTSDALPIYSPVVLVPLAVKVTFSVRSSASGLVRLYGTVSPAVSGAHVIFQVLKDIRPGANEVTSRYVGQFKTKLKRGGATFSRFSLVTKIKRAGRYRVYVQLRGGGAVISGYSTRTIVLRATK